MRQQDATASPQRDGHIANRLPRGCNEALYPEPIQQEPLMPIIRMSELDLRNKRVLIRQDLNVPIEDGRITSEQRITASLPTLRLALEKGATVLVTSHLGRPKEGEWSEADSLAPVAARLSELLGRDVPLHARLGRWCRRTCRRYRPAGELPHECRRGEG